MNSASTRLAALYAEERTRLQRRYLRRGLSAEEAADLVQDAFLRLLRAPLEEVADLRAYLYRTTDNAFADAIRCARRARMVTSPGVLLDEEAPDARLSVEAALIAQEESEALDQALAELPPRCREVLRLHKFENLSYVEISERMGISRNTVMVHMVKGLGVLRRRLRPEAQEGAAEEGGAP